MKDYIVRATAGNAQIRAFAIYSKNLVEEARQIHNTCPTVTAALGRLLTAGAMMGVMMKGDKDVLTLQVKGDGPLKGITVTADSQGTVKGYPIVPQVNLPAGVNHKLNVGGAIGNGILSVIKDMGLKDPYVGQTALQTGEIAEDLTYYFAVSEQIPSSVGLGVLMNKEDNTVKQAGGFIVQLMPFAEESTIAKLEENIQKLQPVTTMLDEGKTPEQILEILLDGLDVQVEDTVDTKFACNCDKDRVEKALIAIGKKEIGAMIAEGKPVELGCQFCGSKYTFTVEELQNILQRIK